MNWRVEPADEGQVQPLLHAYLAEVIGRYYGRPATEAEIDIERESGARRTPHMLWGLRGGQPAGIVGVRRLDADTAELTRMYITPEHRGTGGGTALLEAADDLARSLHAKRIRLDTRSDLIEARRRYERYGYREISRYNDGPYAEHWFERSL